MKEALEYLKKVGVDPHQRVGSSKGGTWSILGLLKDFKSEFNFIDSSLTFKNKRKTDMEKLVSDKEIEQAFGYADFGRGATKRDIINSTLLKYASGYTTGHTAKCIALELGLINAKEKLTKKGKEYLYEAFSIGLSL